MSDIIKKPLTIQELTSKAGKASVAKFTKEELRERATRASHARKCYKDLPKITHSGEIVIGKKTISCAVLEDGRRIISQSAIYEILEKALPNARTREKGKIGLIPSFIAVDNLKPFITKEMMTEASVVRCQKKSGGLFNGFEASLLPDICEVYLKARDADILNTQQKHIASQCEIVMRALSKVGLTALIDESSGYQAERERDDLQKFLSKYISAELLPWTKRFPQQFFDAYKKMYGVEKESNCPSHVGHLINSHVYEELAPSILEELKDKNPKGDNGRRKHTHHQFLTEDIGIDALQKQLIEVTTLMKVAKDKDHFKELYKLSRD